MRKYIPALILLIIFIPSVIIYYKYNSGKTDEILQQLNTEYPAISINDRITGVITSIYHGDPKVFNNDPHHAYLILNDTVKLRVKTSYDLSQKFLFDDVIEEGDRFVKESGTDIFYIHKALSTYTFELRDDLGYPLKK